MGVQAGEREKRAKGQVQKSREEATCQSRTPPLLTLAIWEAKAQTSLGTPMWLARGRGQLGRLPGRGDPSSVPAPLASSGVREPLFLPLLLHFPSLGFSLRFSLPSFPPSPHSFLLYPSIPNSSCYITSPPTCQTPLTLLHLIGLGIKDQDIWVLKMA